MTKRTIQKKRKIRALIAGTLIGVPILFLYLILSFYYNNHFYHNTVINGVMTSNKTVNGAKEKINDQVRTYSLSLKERNDESEQIQGVNIELNTVFDETIQTLLEEQNGFTWPVSIFKKHQFKVKTMIEYDEALLAKQVDELACFETEHSIEPVNAYISDYNDQGYEIIPEDNGAKVKKEVLLEAVKNAITSLKPSLSLDESDCYEKPVVTTENEKLQKALKKMNKMVGTKITYEFGDVTEVLDGSQINKWLSMDEKYKVSLDKEGIKEFVNYIGKNYNSFGKIRTFQTSYGDVLQIQGGDYGWWLDRTTEISDLAELIKDGKELIREPAYFQVAQQYGKDDIGNTYVEINLTAQHLFFYKEGKLIVETDFVSGNISKKYGTPTGTYPIQYKETEAVLIGEDYETPVKYWMPFNGNIGLHDASWRSSFGKDIYMKKGSHGCINMPPAAAKTMFENISRGVAVVVYELKGTETYNKE